MVLRRVVVEGSKERDNRKTVRLERRVTRVAFGNPEGSKPGVGKEKGEMVRRHMLRWRS